MNSVPYQLSPHLGTTLKPCHPERSLAESEANRQTQSEDPYQRDAACATESNFRIVIRFFDEHEAAFHPVSDREAAAGEFPARHRRGCAVDGTSPEGMALSYERITQ